MTRVLEGSAAGFKAFLEACHDGPRNLEAWAREVTRTLNTAVEPRSGMVMSSAVLGRGWAFLAAEGEAGVLTQAPPVELPPDLVRAAFTPFRVARLSAHAGIKNLEAVPAFRAIAPGFSDVLGLFASVEPLKLVMSLPLKADDTRSPREPVFHRAQRHLQAAVLSRADHHGWLEGAELIIDEAGRPLHVGSAGGWILGRANEIAGAFARDMTEPGEDATGLWDELLGGGWTLATTRQSDGKRLLVLRRVQDGTRRKRQGRLLGLLVRGAALKEIAAELGIAMSTASYHVDRLLEEAGVSSAKELAVTLAGKPISERRPLTVSPDHPTVAAARPPIDVTARRAS
ncbi:MAG: hypothetical protein HOW73_27930 [Polyangiaceae bacterium]|nr:hypothetical protein [Polyangiaceae bacterium]